MAKIGGYNGSWLKLSEAFYKDGQPHIVMTINKKHPGYWWFLFKEFVKVILKYKGSIIWLYGRKSKN